MGQGSGKCLCNCQPFQLGSFLAAEAGDEEISGVYLPPLRLPDEAAHAPEGKHDEELTCLQIKSPKALDGMKLTTAAMENILIQRTVIDTTIPENEVLHEKGKTDVSAGKFSQTDSRLSSEILRTGSYTSESAGPTKSTSSYTYRLNRSAIIKGKIKRAVSKESNELKRSTNKSRHEFWNTNLPDDYKWLEATLWKIAKRENVKFDSSDLVTGKAYSQLFLVFGACPNTFCGMQAVLFSTTSKAELDFWWVKPCKDDGRQLEPNTLNRHSKGIYKNDPGRSKPFYQAFADLFSTKADSSSMYTFGISRVAGSPNGESPRAWVEQFIDGQSCRYWLLAIWQEEWSSNPFAFTKYIKGKLVYQRQPTDDQFFSRSYSIVNGVMTLSEDEDSPFSSPLPGIEIKLLEQ